MSAQRPADHRADPTLRVSPVNQYERILVALAGLLGRAPAGFDVAPAISLDEPTRANPVDVAVYDTFGSTDAPADVSYLCQRRDVGHVVVLAAETEPAMTDALLAAGADAVVSKLQPPADLFRSIRQVAGTQRRRHAP